MVNKWLYILIGSLVVFVLTVAFNVYNIWVGLDYLSLALLIVCPVIFVVAAVMFSIRMFKNK